MPHRALSHALNAVILDGSGGTLPLPEDPAEALPAGLLWLHMDYHSADTVAWLWAQSGIDPIVLEALTAESPRPRSLAVGDGLLVILRGININEGANPEDMISLRLWLTADRVLTLRHRSVAAAQDVLRQLAAGSGPVDTGDLLHELIDRLLDRIGPLVEDIEDTVDELEELVLHAESRGLRVRLSELRRQSIALRRYLAPQREVIGHLQGERVGWLRDESRARLRESADRITRFVETLDAARERAAVTSEELSNRLAEQMNQTMYLLSVVAAIFLPLGLLTGLLGINVGGMPGTDSPWAFGVVSVLLVVLGIAEWAWFKRSKIL